MRILKSCFIGQLLSSALAVSNACPKVAVLLMSYLEEYTFLSFSVWPWWASNFLSTDMSCMTDGVKTDLQLGKRREADNSLK